MDKNLLNAAQSRKSTGKSAALVVLVAVVTAVAVTLVQRWLLGDASIAVTGGVVGAVTGAVAFSTMRKRSG